MLRHFICLLCTLATFAATTRSSVTAAEDDARPPVEAPLPYDFTSRYEDRTIEGWLVRVNRAFINSEPEMAAETLELLKVSLYRVRRRLPAAVLPKLRTVPIWVELDEPHHHGMVYHPNAGWLRQNGMNPDKAKCIEIADARNFLRWSHSQPWMVLHELAHAYHDQVLGGFENAEIKAAFDEAMRSKLYDAVLRDSGREVKAYATTNQMEYFAESSEAFFGCNDFYPFVNAELKEHDPRMHRVLGKVWGVVREGSGGKKAAKSAPASTEKAADPNVRDSNDAKIKSALVAVKNSRRLAARLEPLIRRHQGKVGVAVYNLKTGESYVKHADRPAPTASMIKIAVMVEAYRQFEAGRIDLDRSVTLAEDDKVPGSGVLTKNFSAGTRLPLRDCIRLMIAYSDNTATNLVLDAIGLTSTAETMESLALPDTKIHAKVFRGETSVFPERSREFGLGSTTPAETVRLLTMLHERQLADEKATVEMLDHLYHCESDRKSSRFLPSSVKIAHKGGSVSAVRTDAALMHTPSGPVAMCVMTSENRDRRWSDENAGDRLCAEIGREVYRRFESGTASSADAIAAAKRGLQEGDASVLVEDLQRTLNARLDPSPAMSVDGDFGPATKAVVTRFQKVHGLDPTGVVGPETWKVLGTLVTKAPDPDAFTSEKLTLAPADKLDGPPSVTAKAWAVGDADSGRLLWGRNESNRLAMASTTKMMTAWLVVRLADENPEVLNEDVLFSQRADDTGGSSATIRAGERLKIRDLLFGLLLPSGNDASVALAEHFGGRFEPPDVNKENRADDESDAYSQFIAEMNRTAAALGMKETRYANPHGLSAKGHASSARDLFKLAHRAMQSPLFRRYVATRRHGCTVVGVGGYRRNLAWTNTNRLLAVEGYAGVKTGTTREAGACLVSLGAHDGRELIVVVLGSQASAARYTDARNLYRWAWRELADGRSEASD